MHHEMTLYKIYLNAFTARSIFFIKHHQQVPNKDRYWTVCANGI